jgi:catechol 2,3-dioxygenase-like lactoylglutathione lyase family enzyme
MKLRTGEPWITAREYGRSLKGLTLNLLAPDIERAVHFQREVLKMKVIYSDADFAVVQGHGAEWMFHADHTYEGHAMEGVIARQPQRGAGAEFRLHGCDPDAAEAATRRLDYKVLAGATDKNYGLREAHLVDADGYVWVPDVPTQT